MRSRIDIKTRLAAHITALFFLIVIWSCSGSYHRINSTMSETTKSSRIAIRASERPETFESVKPPIIPETQAISGPIQTPEAPVAAPPLGAAGNAEPAKSVPPETPEAPESVQTPEAPVAAPPLGATEAAGNTEPDKSVSPETPEAPESVQTPEAPVAVPSLEAAEKADPDNSVLPEMPETPGPVQVPEAQAQGIVQSPDGEKAPVPPIEPGFEAAIDPGATVSEVPQAENAEKAIETFLAIPPQPDESGALKVAKDDPAVPAPDLDLAPLANGSLEVLDDGVYWFVSGDDVAKGLAAAPEVKTLVLLAPDRKAELGAPEGIRVETIPARLDDIGVDAAERFLALEGEDGIPLVIAALPGADGAAFFKGAYLLLKRGRTLEEVFEAIAPDLPVDGAADEEIRHRLSRLQMDVER